ncbi:MAG: hypothetical protein VX938_07290, partial [Myxococcota bacterium]|nr:hypothetical protein [Myxococcota bacterium]
MTRQFSRWSLASLFAVSVMVSAPAAWSAGETGSVSFSEDDKGAGEWAFEWHGYARMPLRLQGNPADVRFPYLVDDDYYQSGFNYLRNNEKEWVELFFGAKRDNTRFVAGLFASELSDWSKAAFPGQGGISTAFLEQGGQLGNWLTFRARAGMFWERFGYVQPYDTYLFGRTHISGLSLTARLFDM